MTDERRTVNYRHIFKVYNENEGISLAHHPVDRTNAFNMNNHGELTTSEYLEYTHYLENDKVRSARRFPLVNPTKEDYSKLIQIVENLELDLE
jgi:hypothetical protein